MYTPKLYLVFEPPIKNSGELQDVLNAIENHYPEVYWKINGKLKPTDYNVLIQQNVSIVGCLTIGYHPYETDVLTFGEWCDDDSDEYDYREIKIDGYQWLSSYATDFDTTTDMFNSLNESQDLSGIDWRKTGIYFDANVTVEDVWKTIGFLSSLGFKNGVNGLYPWTDNDVDEFIKYVRNRDKYSNALVIEDGGVDNILHGRCDDDGRKCLYYKELLDVLNTGVITDFFDSLNEEGERTVNHTTIPQLHLLFNPVIETKDQLNRVLTIIQMIYPNLKWVSNKLISEYNPFDSEMDVGEVIEGLNITKEDGSYKGGKMTYNCLVDLGDSSTPPHMDGWEWIQKHTSDTNQIFNSLYENTNNGINLEDGTSIVFPYDYKDEDVYKLLNWLIQNGWVKGYGDRDFLKQMLFDLDRPWHKGKRRPFFMLRKGVTYGEPTVYWASTGDLTTSPKTFSKVIKAEDLLSSIETDFFM